ncbi:MAG: circadian clock protein KaiC [Caldilineaceae bacterium]|nr:circadian clock protein KaiC [Caldilineaceae bacterium]
MSDPAHPFVDPQAKAPTGIEGFDEITRGGLPRNRTSLVMGGPGTGKTVFALQFLVNGARDYDEPGIFVTFEETSQRIVANAAGFGWDLPDLQEQKLFFLDAQLLPDVVYSGAFDLQGLLVALEAKIVEMGAKRIVFDSIDVLLNLLADPKLERHEVYRLHHWLTQCNVTSIITAKLDEATQAGFNDLLRGYSFMQYMVDCLVHVNHRIENRVSLRNLRVMKYRGSDFAENEVSLVIGATGMKVANLGEANYDYRVSNERVSTGVERLDQMLSGGYYRGSSVLITGVPGTAKSTLSGALAAATCALGEAVLYVSFDEAANEIVRNLTSVNIQLKPYRDNGLLHMYSMRSEARSAEEQLLYIRGLIDRHQPTCVIIDPISAMMKSGGELEARQVAQRLLHSTKAQGITLLTTSLLETTGDEIEATDMQVSTLADTWIHLSYVEMSGERNRALSIIKSRGTGHSNQVRELLLTDDGVTLADAYTAGGEVLMGTLRWEKEQRANQLHDEQRREVERRRRQLRAAENELKARIAALEAELTKHSEDLVDLNRIEAAQEKQWQQMIDELKRLRGVEE